MKDEKVHENSVLEKLLKFLTYKLLEQLVIIVIAYLLHKGPTS